VREQGGMEPKPGQIVISERPINQGFHLPSIGLAALADREIRRERCRSWGPWWTRLYVRVDLPGV